jgi:glycosyltransferase involved in cell wall biosynthesis
MKVCALADSLEPTSGPGRYSAGLLRSLGARVGSLDVILPAGHPPATLESSPGRAVVHRLLPSRHLFYSRGALLYPLVVVKALQIVPILRGADVVHSLKDYPFSLIAALGAALCRKTLVVNAYGTFSVIPFRSWPDRALLRFVYRRAARIISISRHTKERLGEFIGSEKILVIPGGVDTGSFGPGPERAPRREWAKPFLLSVGEIKERKGFDTSIGAFCRIAADFPGLSYYLAGAAEEGGTLRALRQRVASEGAGARIRFLGRVDEGELRWLYHNCELFLLTPRTDSLGRFEGFGLVYLEAGACGKAVIGTRGCGAEDAIVDGETGMLVQADVGDVARALRSLLTDRQLAERFGRRGQLRADALSWDRVADQVLEIYSGTEAG